MSGLPRPELPAGPHRDLVADLHALHHRAGWPSLRSLASTAGCSPTTVSAVFSVPRLPSWGLLEVLVDAMGGDVPRFHELWIAAGSGHVPPPTTVPIAGRHHELARVRLGMRRPGLLLVEGEAGIGKSRLIASAVADLSDDVLVAAGDGLPLSGDVPLLPLADALRRVWVRDGGELVRAVLADQPAYVTEVLALLLPELEVGTGRVPDDAAWARHRLLGALTRVLADLAARRPFALVLEDLHWADAGTLDVVEHLLAQREAVPVVATWRTGDPATDEQHEEWRRRVLRSPRSDVLELGPLTRDETARQLSLLSGGPASDGLVDAVHRRTLGQPLFNEQLVSETPDGAWPAVLTDLLDRRLHGLDEEEWRIVAALGVAERPLEESVLGRVSGIGDAALARHVRNLRDRVLLASGDEVALRHPLLAEAVRRRITAVERRDLHGTLARELASSTDPPAAEVAAHWQGAGEAGEELVWRLLAAQAAQERFALADAAVQWSRAIEVWPPGLATAGLPPMRRPAAALEAIDSVATRHVQQALELARAEEDHLADMTEEEVARLYQRLGDLIGATGSAEEGLGYLRWALRIYSGLPPSAARVDALERLAGVLSLSGRRAEAAEVSKESVFAARTIGEPRQLRNLLASHAWYLAAAGDNAEAERAIVESSRIEVPDGDPMGDVEIAIAHTDILLRAAAPAAAVVDAARGALSAVHEWRLSTYTTSMLRANVAIALRRAGDADDARELVEADLTEPPDLDNWVAHIELACLDIVTGDLDRARSVTTQIRALGVRGFAHRTELHAVSAELDLWAGRPAQALEVVMPVLHESLETEETESTWLLIATAARAIGDLGRSDLGLPLRDLMFAIDGVGDAAVPAFRAAAEAELARAGRSDTLADWERAIAAWDRLGRPHDAAYARWRGAQAARRTGEASTSDRLLRRAARDARGHVPLTTAIAAT